eukprot:gnl/Chilomastix_caulleri/6888.p1 GENE.gnl/Chilomastix_caulleri/6888~~gnl/Chilomastix_caulleri/6888.p1  ORF type:complete len:122 (+),score=25.83 gnl/Chilomastix_caulleri/6888:162-527(+)
MGFLEGNLQQSPVGCIDDGIPVVDNNTGGATDMTGDKGYVSSVLGNNNNTFSERHYPDIATENEISALPGDPVTQESYDRWWKQFVESGAADWIFNTRLNVSSDKLTGKQMWLKGELKIEE